MPFKVQSLDHLVLTVADMDETCAFYTLLGMQVADFQPTTGAPRKALHFGTQKINLHPASGPFDPKAEYPTPGSADLCFLSDTPIDDWVSHLRAQGIEIEEGPVPRSGAQGPILSIYLRDPDGNLIEISNPA
ncbi:VOC family protein [Sagittula sp. S175]|uniref:VOC family protein n=1 Tax=Sagittula sp. S175 TaxID=3415129 RepID=UPI003C79F83B